MRVDIGLVMSPVARWMTPVHHAINLYFCLAVAVSFECSSQSPVSFAKLCCVSKNVPPLACYNFDTPERIVIFFGRNVTDKVSNQKTLYCATSNNVCFCTTWQNGETRKSHFLLKCCISALPEFNQLLLDFFSFFDSRLVLMLLYVSLNLLINACSAPGCCGAWFRREEIDSAAAVGLRCMHNACAPMRWLPERKKMLSVMCLIASDICWDSNVSR